MEQNGNVLHVVALLLFFFVGELDGRPPRGGAIWPNERGESLKSSAQFVHCKCSFWACKESEGCSLSAEKGRDPPVVGGSTPILLGKK